MTRPLGNYILIKPEEPEQPSGVIVTMTKKTPNVGEVIAISEDADVSVAVGDRVQYLPNGRLDNEDGTCLVKEENILFVFNDHKYVKGFDPYA